MPKIIAERRDRRVMFRLSEEEHERLRRICIATHKRSVSELVRQAIDHWMEGGSTHSGGDLRAKLDDLEGRVAVMTARIGAS